MTSSTVNQRALVKLAYKLGFSEGLRKAAVSFSPDNSTFTLEPGQTLTSVVNARRKADPSVSLTADDIVRANSGLHPTKYRAGVQYKLPSVSPAQTIRQEQTRTPPTYNGPVRIPDQVKHYFDVIVPYIKQRGNPDQSRPEFKYNTMRYGPRVYEKPGMSVDPASVAARGDRASAYATAQGGIVFRNPVPDPGTIVHELKHFQNLDGLLTSINGGPLVPLMSGRSPMDDARLARAYPLQPSDIRLSNDAKPKTMRQVANERATTHAEHQFRIMQELWGKLGRPPRPEEFTQYIESADPATVRRWRSIGVNGYQNSMDARRGVPESDLGAYIDALGHVAKNNVRGQPDTGVMSA